MGTYLRVEEAIRDRTCSLCGDRIKSGRKHIAFNSNSRYKKNACKKCVGELMEEILI